MSSSGSTAESYDFVEVLPGDMSESFEALPAVFVGLSGYFPLPGLPSMVFNGDSVLPPIVSFILACGTYKNDFSFGPSFRSLTSLVSI